MSVAITALDKSVNSQLGTAVIQHFEQLFIYIWKLTVDYDFKVVIVFYCKPKFFFLLYFEYRETILIT